MIPFLVLKMHRRGVFWFAGGGFLLSFFYGLAFKQAAGTTAADHAAFGRASLAAAEQFKFMIPLPTHPETLGGYEQYKWLSGAIVLMMFWAVLVAVGVARGDDDRGLTAEWLAAGVSRMRLVLSRTAAFAIVLLVACVASTLGISAVAPVAQQDPNVAGELAKALSMFVGIMTGYGLALLVAELPAERQTGTAAAVGLIVLLFVVNGFADTLPSVSGIGVVSPWHWMNLTTTGAPGGTFDIAATVGLLVAAGLFCLVAIEGFRRRDVGGGLFAWGGGRKEGVVRVAARGPWLRSPFTEGLWEQRVGLTIWAAGMLFLGASMVPLTKSMADAISSDKTIVAMFQRLMGGSIYAALLGLAFFGFALLTLAGYAVVQVSRWSTQDQDGRVEMLLSAPVRRSRVVMDRALEFALASLVLVVAAYIGAASKLPSSGLGIDAGRVLVGMAMMWPFVLALGGIGVAVASRWPRIAVPFLAIFAVVEWFLADLAPIFKMPDWVANLSIFHLYGNPLLGDISIAPVLWMSAVFVVGFGIALLLMQRRDFSGTA